MKKIRASLLLLSPLFLSCYALGDTIAHWDFETDMVDSNTANGVAHTSAAGTYQAVIQDLSGNANHLSAWNSTAHVFSSAVLVSTKTSTTKSLQNNGGLSGLLIQ